MIADRAVIFVFIVSKVNLKVRSVVILSAAKDLCPIQLNGADRDPSLRSG
jgi:hypothetical protein